MLAHRIPYPPDKGDKLRAFQWLKHLSSHYRIYLGCFVDDRADRGYLPVLKNWCEEVFVAPINPRWQRLKSLRGLVTGQALSLPYFFDAGLARWVDSVIVAQQIDRSFIYCSTMAQYVLRRPGMAYFADFVDLDSAKWAQYAGSQAGLGWLYRRESRRLLAFEKAAAARARAVFFVTDAEAQLFRDAGGAQGEVRALGNGVDTDYFSPGHAFESPFQQDERAIVFTGVMDYWPNVDAVCWFAREVLPLVLAHQRVRFYVVGMRPTRAVLALAGAHVVVTGRVADVRPYLTHAAVAVAPLRIARGVQNKVLEAMAMGRPVVASTACAASISGVPGVELAVAGDAQGFARALLDMLAMPPAAAALGLAGRDRVVRDYNWAAQFQKLDACMGAVA